MAFYFCGTVFAFAAELFGAGGEAIVECCDGVEVQRNVDDASDCCTVEGVMPY